MKLYLASADPDVLSLCREMFAEFPDTRWVITTGLPACSSEANLVLWDFVPGADLPLDAAWGTKHFALVRRKSLAALRSAHPEIAASVLLKPLTRPMLRAVFAQALAAASDQPAPAADLIGLQSDRDTLLQCLIEANLKLQEYDQERTNFLTRAVHDFRAPLTALTGYCGLLMEDHLGPLTAAQRDVLRRMLHSGRRLSRMANAMFQLSVGRRVQQQPNFIHGEIRDCIEQALYEVGQFTEEKRIETVLDVSPCPGLLSFEPGQIEQALINLLDNACKFTPRGGVIEVRGYPWFWERRAANVAGECRSDRREHQINTPNAYRIDVRDSGPGIPDEHIEEIFEEYTLYPAGQDRSGGGLGLAICKLILTQHNGRIWAESSRTGATFSLVLPMAGMDASWHSNGRGLHAEAQRA